MHLQVNELFQFQLQVRTFRNELLNHLLTSLGFKLTLGVKARVELVKPLLALLLLLNQFQVNIFALLVLVQFLALLELFDKNL